MDGSAPQRVQEDLETHQYYDAQQNKEAVASQSHTQDLRDEYTHRHKSQKIAGLSTRTFWLVIALVAVVVIAASVGGAVGGTAHSKKSDKMGPSTAISFSSRSSSFTSTSASSTTSSSTSSATPSTFNATTDCPGSNSTLYTPLSRNGGAGMYTFLKLCGFDHSNATFNNMAAFVYNFEACIAMCANMNEYRDAGGTTSTCVAVSYLATASMPANCWSSNSSSISSVGNGVSVGLLIDT